MEKDNADSELERVVRRYSLKIAEERPDDPLSQALGITARNDEAAVQGNSDWTGERPLSQVPLGEQELTILNQQRERMIHSQAQFHERLGLENVKAVIGPQPTIKELIQNVEESMTVWSKKKESGFGKAMDRIRKFLVTMDDYGFLFDLIPDGHLYTSLVTGAISSVVKASVNHKHIAEGFSSYLAEINQDLRSVQKSLQIADTEDMRRFVVELYNKMFDFLCEAMRWYQSTGKRWKSAWNQNSQPELSDKVSAIRAVLVRISHEAEYITQTRIKESHAYVMQSERMQMKIAADESRIHDNVDQISASHSKPNARAMNGKRENTDFNAEGDIDIIDENEGEQIPHTRYELEELASCLEKYLEDGRSEVLRRAGTSKPMLPREVLVDIDKWIKIPSSSLLWIEGPAYTHFENQLSSAIARIYDLALSAKMPCIFFSPKARYEVQSKKVTSPMDSRRQSTLIALLYFITGQLIRVLPYEFESHLKLEEMFGSLDESLASASVALNLIESLLEYAPPMLLVIIDKLHLADSQETRPYLTRLITILRGRNPSRSIKTLFTTAGKCGALVGATKRGERVDAGRMIQGKPGQPLRGWSSVGDFKLR
ncbi:hypothetical protein F5Y07DRAFT_345993 [Xylaria sp. FL0933]|nr:hypothetical protein F5Y07DRAFT_345993 [Xylaria sp. FL0933]